MSAGEFEIIREIFAPLSAGAAGAFNLADDAAAIADGALIVTKDLIVEGVHFRKSDPLDLVARKLIRVNLSDLAAKGAKPIGYFLGCVFPASVTRAQIELFASGLEEDQKAYGVALYGGDTTRQAAASAPFTLSATVFGAAPRQGMVRRIGAAAGDDLFVSGTVGDSGLGLAVLEKSLRIPSADKPALVARYHLPEPRVALGGALPGLASAAIDVSDGLLADAGHLADAAGLAVHVEAAQVPMSEAARRFVDGADDADAALGRLCAFGDDYEILFAAPPTRRRAVEMAAKLTKTQVARIGSFSKGKGVRLLGAKGAVIETGSGGYDHFARRDR